MRETRCDEHDGADAPDIGGRAEARPKNNKDN